MPRTDSYPGSIDRHGQSWRWRVSVDGTRHWYFLPKDGDKELPPEPDLEDIQSFARREYEKLKEEAKTDRGRAITVSALFDHFEADVLPGLAQRSQRVYGDALDRFRLFFVEDGTDPRVRDVDTGDCEAYLSWRRWHSPDGSKRHEALSGHTLQKDRSVLHRCFAKAVDWGYRDGNPVSRTDTPKMDDRDPVILDEEQYERLLEEAQASKNPMAGLYVLLLGETGLRSNSEALWLRWEDVDLEDGFLRVRSGRDGHRTKSGEGRWVPLTSRLREALREHAARYRMRTYDGERSPWIFPHEFAFKDVEPGDRIGNMKRAVREAATRAELPDDWRKHDLRHRRITTWLSEGHSPVKVQKAVGHSDLKTTMGYYTFVRSDLESLVEPHEAEKREVAELKSL